MIARLLICPSPDTLRSNLEDYRTNDPDILYFKTGEKLGIAEARKIIDHFSLKPYSAKGRVVIIEEAGDLTPEAQNALLKTIEELPNEAVFIMCSNSDARILPTILSRCQIVRVNSSQLTVNSNEEDIEQLLKATIEQRFEYVEKLKDKEEFLNSLLLYFHQNILIYPKFTADLLQTEQWAKQNVNMRAILEYLMLVMPVEK